MEAILMKLLEQLNSAVFALIAILIIAFWMVYKFGGITKTFGDFKEKNKELDANIGGIKDTLATIKATTDLLYQAHISTIQSHSPISLSPLGRTYSSDLDMAKKVAKHWDEIKKEIEKKSPNNPYDVQTVTMEISRQCFDTSFSEEEKSEIKLYAYQKGVNLLQIIPIIGIIIRDKYLQEKGISVDQIDQHDPKRNNKS
jgi:hypothetical protein